MPEELRQGQEIWKTSAEREQRLRRKNEAWELFKKDNLSFGQKMRKEIRRIVVSAVFSSKEEQREGKAPVDG